MSDSKQANMTHRSVGEIRESVQKQMDKLREDSCPIPDNLQLLFKDLTEYNEVLEEREKAMQGALVNLVDDMSQTSQTLCETGTRLDAILKRQDVPSSSQKKVRENRRIQQRCGADIRLSQRGAPRRLHRQALPRRRRLSASGANQNPAYNATQVGRAIPGCLFRIPVEKQQ